MLIRRVSAVLLFGLLSACSSTKTSSVEAPARPTSPIAAAISGRVVDACASNRSKCKFEGSYEAGERDYAEQEAKRLNMAELERLRRAFGN
ncbi:Lipoprotein [Bordetella sputigena]